ncbi:aaa family protein [Cystoisospora suis]|uniref:Aaa family protein n=1 Tax=Cystoisospora suis TaxID=483139 RepID=A0A2C6LDL5_9APIC|nr:aaa family protein [Cystoisospora suis]
MSHQTYNDKWARAVEDLKELLQLEQDCSQLPGTSQEAAIFNPKVTRLYVRYVLATNEIEECHHHVTQPQKRLHIRKLLDGLLRRILELKKLVIDTSPREGCPHLYITDVLSYLDVTPEQALLRLPRYLRDDPAIADTLDVKMQKLKYWAATLRADPFRECSAATTIQAAWRGHVARSRVLLERQADLKFWGLDFDECGDGSSDAEDKHFLDQILKRRKIFQIEAAKAHHDAQQSQLEWLRNNVACEMLRTRVDEGREWMLEFRRQVGALPSSVEDRMKDFDGVPPPPPDGRPYKIGVPGADKKPAPKAKSKPEPPKKDGKDKKKPKEPEPPSEPARTLVDDLSDIIEEFEKVWARFKCRPEEEQQPDEALTRESLMPQVDAEVSERVEEILKQELTRLRQQLDYIKEKPAKKKKGGQKKKKGKEKKVKCCNAMSLVGPAEDIFPDLVKDGILKAIEPATLDDLRGSFPLTPLPTTDFVPPPTMWHIKQYLVEQIILPLAVTEIRQQTRFPAKSLLLYGPPGSGKSLIARIIATEAGAMFYDLSPSVTENIYKHPKTGASLMIHKTFLSAQENAPAVIYIDNVDEVFMPKKPPKKKGSALENPSTAWRIRDTLKAHLNLIKKAGGPLSASDRILLVGCTSRPCSDRLDQKGMSDFFEHKLWINFPDYESRRVLWQTYLRKKSVSIPTLDTAKLSVLAEMTDGYTAGALETATDYVLSDPRVARLPGEPLEPREFTKALSRLPYCWPEEWLKFRNFDFVATGERDRVAARKAKAEAERAAAEKAKKNKRK